MTKDTDDAPTLQELAELLQRDAPPVADVPFTLTPPRSCQPRAAAGVLPFGADDNE